MKYQLIVQWPATSIKDYDSMIEVEEILIERLTELHEIDGHDMGSGEMNIFIHTDDYERAFSEVMAILKEHYLWINVRVAYREIDKNEYTILWPKGLNQFSVT